MRILIVDDHEVVRLGIRGLLETQPDWLVCGEGATGREAVACARRLQPDLVVLDFTLPELGGLEVIRQLRRVTPGTRILVLTIHQSEELAQRCLQAGARGYVLKADASHELVAAARAVLQDRPFVSRRLAPGLARGRIIRSTPPGRAGERLSPREFEVLQLLAEGHSGKEIGDRLRISPQTAQTHRRNLMRKLELHSAAALIRYAIRNGITAA
jgi:DNA-binding NarL/FixJ family response regulator